MFITKSIKQKQKKTLTSNLFLLFIQGEFKHDPKLGTCSITVDKWGRSSKTALFITGFIIPCIVIVCCYTGIFWVIRK